MSGNNKRFIFHPTSLSGLLVIESKPIEDSRGYLERLYCADQLKEVGCVRSIVQINHTLTFKTGTVRGMHFQKSPCAEMKLVYCIRGAVWDVVVDLRPDSETFLKWHGEELTSNNQNVNYLQEVMILSNTIYNYIKV